ncbi:unnamed protein product [Mytilus coruscus]|uniref:B box-type domain-containing protein n=1 Tax=Mytilus coruscus TaxID=42192 RepID=A0A6J8BWA6_MYTCO|nr:unnamed protein product [Mytilus coruscus]
MASSNLVRHSQSIKQCGVCETIAKIEVKCIDCDLFMCETCKRNHSKYKDAEIHMLVDIKDITVDDEYKYDSCNKLVCPACIEYEHRKHELKKIEHACTDQLNKISKVQDEVSTVTNLYLGKLDKLEKVNHLQYNEILHQIKQDQIEAMGKINQTYNDEKEKLERQRFLISYIITSRKDTIEKQQENIEKQKKHLHDIAQSRETASFFEKKEEFERQLEEVTDSIYSNHYHSKILQYTKGLVFGMEPKTTTNEIDVTIQQEYNADFNINDLKIDKRKTIWTSSIDNINQFEVKKCDENLTFTKKTSCPAEIGQIGKIGLTNMNNLVFISSTGIHILKKMDEKIMKIVGFTEYKPKSIHISKENQLFIGMSFDDVKNSTDKAIIKVFSLEGKRLTAKTIFNTGNKFLINGSVTGCATFNNETIVGKETSNKGTICYIDYNCKGDPHCGRLIKLNLNRDIQWVYRGSIIINSEKSPFNPCSMVVTEQDNIVLLDLNQSSLHIIQPNGLLLTLADLSLVGIQSPRLMTLDGDGHMWINTLRHTKTGKLYELKISGF